jgi:hypothetical protein
MDPEHYDLRDACRRVGESHISAVTAADVERVSKLVTPEDVQAAMFVMAERYRFGELLAFTQPHAMERALRTAAATHQRNALGRAVVRSNKILQCSVLENMDEEAHKECQRVLVESGLRPLVLAQSADTPPRAK